MDLPDDAETLRARLRDALEAARRNHDIAERNLLAAEQGLVLARVALEQARRLVRIPRRRDACREAEGPPRRGSITSPAATTASGSSTPGTRGINLCPACHERVRRGAMSFYQLRGLMVPRQ